VTQDINLLKAQLKALKLMQSDYEKLSAKMQKKRDKELEKFNHKTNGLSREELADSYGYGEITLDEYYEALKRLEDGERREQEALDATPVAQYLKMIYRDIKDAATEIYEIEDKLGIKHQPSESRDQRRRRLGLEPKN
jgi:(p)ppGpp synthase/HD superfamily hydrolase